MKKGLFSLTNLSLKKKKDFDIVYTKGEKKVFSFFFVYFYPFSGVKRLGISIPKRFGKAVYRNRQKRLIREGFRKYFCNIPEGFYIFHLYKKPEDELSEKREIEDIFKCLSLEK